MTIAWFTPFSKKSAIGRCSGAIVTELSKYANVDIWHPETSDTHETKVKTVRFSHAERLDFTRLSAYDLIVYNLGNHLPFHREIFQVARRFSGICILHDFVMHHFFSGYYLEFMKRPQSYTAAMYRL